MFNLEEKDVANILSATDDRNNMIKYIRQFWPATFFGMTGENGSPVQYHHLRNIDVGKLCAPGEDKLLRVFICGGWRIVCNYNVLAIVK